MHGDDEKMNELNPLPTLLREHGDRKAFKNVLRDVAGSGESTASAAHRGNNRSRSASRRWDRLRINMVAASCVALVTAFATLWLSGYYKTMEKNSSNYRELRRDMNNVKRNVNEHNQVIRGISEDQRGTIERNNFGATGFVLSPDGYVVTNHHVIADADSVHLQNAKGHSYKAKVIHTDPRADLAILKIVDSTFVRLNPTPYTFKRVDSELGEDVFTLGFPRDEAVYGQGYLSSMSGYRGDTTAYQISIPLNPGNSGGPLLDSRGHVIGIISGKQAGLDGASFAIKTRALLQSLERISADSLDRPIQLSQRNSLSRLSRVDQIKRIEDYVFIVKVF